MAIEIQDFLSFRQNHEKHSTGRTWNQRKQLNRNQGSKTEFLIKSLGEFSALRMPAKSMACWPKIFIALAMYGAATQVRKH